MKNYKMFKESLNEGEPEIGDYVFCQKKSHSDVENDLTDFATRWNLTFKDCLKSF